MHFALHTKNKYKVVIESREYLNFKKGMLDKLTSIACTVAIVFTISLNSPLTLPVRKVTYNSFYAEAMHNGYHQHNIARVK